MQYGLYLEVNLICSLILAIFVYRLQTSIYMKKGQRLLILSLIMNILFFMSDAIWAMVDGGFINSNLGTNYFINIVYFSVSGIAAFFWLLYCANIQGSILYKNRTVAGLLAIPAVILIILTINSPFTGWIFYLDSNGKYFRGNLYYLQVIIVYSYILTSSVISFINARKKDNWVYHSLYLSFGFFGVISLVGVGLQILFPGYPMTAISLTIPLIIAFLSITDSQVLIDFDTNLYNRRWLRNYHTSLHRPDGVSDTDNGMFSRYICVLELVNLPIIRDIHGKTVSKLVIKKIADILSDIGYKAIWQGVDLLERCSCEAVRYSENRFVLLIESNHPENIDSIKKYIGEEVSKITIESPIPLNINLQFGQAMYDPDIEYFQDLTEIAISRLKRL